MIRLIVSFLLSAAAVIAASADIKWHGVDSLPLFGKCIDDTSTSMRFQRLPDSLEHKVKRADLFMLGKHSAGMAIRFSSDAPAIYARWKSVFGRSMNHMTPTGTRGLDLYVMQPDSTWTFVQSARPDMNNKTTETLIIGNMDPVMREYMLYLSLYDGTDSLSIGVDSSSQLLKPMSGLPCKENPILYYGTSITQGGCANRPGMAHTNILQRRLNREVVNLGFSGNGQLDIEIADIIAAVHDPALVILDFVPNVTYEQVDTLLIPFVETIKAAHPNVPVLIIEDPDHPTKRFDRNVEQKCASRRVLLKEKFDELASRFSEMYYLPAEGLLGFDNEHTVDGLHFTDIGFIRYATSLQPTITKILNKK